MKRILSSIAIILFLSACSMNEVITLLVTPTAPPPSPATGTVEPTASQTPGQPVTSTPVPTFTSTPTLVRAGDLLDVQTGETLVLPTLVLVPTATSGPQISFFNRPGSLILSISVSDDTLFWGYCDAPKYVDFDVRVVNSPRLGYVLLFLRLVDKGGSQSTAWGAGAIMKDMGDGSYSYRITPEHLTHYKEFRDAWIEYQIVASTGGLKILDSSPVHENSLALKRCLSIEVEE